MKASQVRERVLADHLLLRGMFASLESLARDVGDGKYQLVSALRLEGEALLAQVERHMRWEDVHLRPALCQADAWGVERAERLDADHREQRELFQHALAGLLDPTRPSVILARNLEDLVELLRRDMDEEESHLLDERVLRDDVIAIDSEIG